MPLTTPSDPHLQGIKPATKAELHELGEIAARLGPGKGTRRIKPEDKIVPKQAKVAFGVGAGLLALCIVAVTARAIANRSQAPLPSTTVTPAIQAKPTPHPDAVGQTQGN